MKKITSICNRLVDYSSIVSGVIICLMIIGISIETVLRYFFETSIQGIVELTEYGLLWLTMLGSAWVLKRNGHVRIDILIDFLNTRHRKAWNSIISIVCAVAMLPLIVFGFRETWKAYTKGAYMYSVLELPKYIILVIIPLGCLLLFYQFLVNAWNYYKEYKSE